MFWIAVELSNPNIFYEIIETLKRYVVDFKGSSIWQHRGGCYGGFLGHTRGVVAHCLSNAFLIFELLNFPSRLLFFLKVLAVLPEGSKTGERDRGRRTQAPGPERRHRRQPARAAAPGEAGHARLPGRDADEHRVAGGRRQHLADQAGAQVARIADPLPGLAGRARRGPHPRAEPGDPRAEDPGDRKADRARAYSGSPHRPARTRDADSGTSTNCAPRQFAVALGKLYITGS